MRAPHRLRPSAQPDRPSQNARRRTLLISVALLTVLVVTFLAPAFATAAAGGGSAGFSSGGGGGGGGFGGGGHGKGFALYLLFRLILDIALLGHGLGLVVLAAIALLYWFLSRGMPKLQAFAEARRRQGRAQTQKTRKRERRVELAAAEAADEDPVFGPTQVRADAAELFRDVQQAWDAGDRAGLQRLVSPTLLAEWERRLDDLDRRGWRNHVELLEPPKVEYVGLQRRTTTGTTPGTGTGTTPDRVTTRIEARMRDYVVDRSGRRIKRRGQFTETLRLREFWTLERHGDHWILATIEQGAEGAHALDDRIVQTAWADEGQLRDEAMLEQAAAQAVPSGTRIAEIADLDFAGDARANANDLSLADGRFAPDVLEIAARQAVQAWTEAVDGPDTALRKLAEPAALEDLLYPGDPSHRTRLVIRGTEVSRITITAVDAATEPPTMTIDVAIKGRRYVEDRSTTRVVSGDPARTVEFTERWTLALTTDAATPWRIVRTGSPAPAA
jgi:predicted lipid-binding transport protein (Tim44 family)